MFWPGLASTAKASSMAWLQPLVKMTSCKEHRKVSGKHNHSEVLWTHRSDITSRLSSAREGFSAKRTVPGLTESRETSAGGKQNLLLGRVEVKGSGKG